MTKKNIFLIVFVGLLLGLYVYYFTDWFTSDTIQIVHTIRPQTPRRTRARPDPSHNLVVTFGMNRKYKLKSVKVVPVSQLQTNKYPHAVWHLVSESNSAPIKAFAYGEKIAGMRPSLAGIHEEPLEPNVSYRLLIEADSIKGEHDFTLPPNVAAK